jgi:hypothetical protein
MKLTQTFNTAGSQKLRDFSKKFDRPEPPTQDGPPLPAPKDDIFERMDIATKLEQDNSLEATIDVFPDVRYILLFIIFNVMKTYKSVTTERPVLTPGSYVAYCLYLTYAFALINDYYGRPTTSFPASQFMNDDTRAQLLDALCRAYVPPFMLTIFSALADCNDPRRPGLIYICTLAGSRFNTDFGRYIPAQIFQYMHNLSTEADTSRDVQSAMAALLNTTLFRFATTTTDVHVYNYVAAAYGQDNHIYESWFYDAIKTLFSPVTGKSLLRRTNIQSLPLKRSTITNNPGINNTDTTSNAYIMYLNADSKNSRSTLKFISTFSALVKSDLKGAFQLGAVPDSLNGVNITVHGYSRLSTPTYHDVSTTHSVKKDAIVEDDDEEFATAIGFKQPTKFTAGSRLPSTADQKDTSLPLSKLKHLIQGLVLYQNDDDHKESDEPDKEMSYSTDLDLAPRTVYLDPYTHGDGPISYSMLAGLLIESEELDGSSVPMPNTDTGLAKINRDFLQGAIPLKAAHHAWHTGTRHTVSPLPRTILKRELQKISHDLYSIEVNRLGHMDATVSDATAPTAPAGFKLFEHIRGSFLMFNKFSFSTDPRTHTAPVTLNAWSPYRYVTCDEDEHPADENTYMIVNFRTLYGTHIPLIGMRHPSVVIPIS